VTGEDRHDLDPLPLPAFKQDRDFFLHTKLGTEKTWRDEKDRGSTTIQRILDLLIPVIADPDLAVMPYDQ